MAFNGMLLSFRRRINKELIIGYKRNLANAGHKKKLWENTSFPPNSRLQIANQNRESIPNCLIIRNTVVQKKNDNTAIRNRPN